MPTYIEKAWEGGKPFWAFAIATINYLLSPDKTFATALGCVLIAAVFDIVTRFWAIGQHGTGLSSQKFWAGTSIKLVSYLVIAVLAGLSYRLAPFLQQPSIYLWSVAYAVMFLREVQSIVENMCDAGADLQWLLLWTKRKGQQILEADQASVVAPIDSGGGGIR